MYCLKCGKDTVGSRVFCDACLEGMSQFPVKPDTAVILPHREAQSPAKKQPARKRSVPPEEQVVHLKKRLRHARFALAVLFLVLCLSAAMLARHLLSEEHASPSDPAHTVNTTSQS